MHLFGPLWYSCINYCNYLRSLPNLRLVRLTGASHPPLPGAISAASLPPGPRLGASGDRDLRVPQALGPWRRRDFHGA